MLLLWRISNHESLSGLGGLRYAARWHSAGRPIVYLAESPAGAMIEALVHLELEEQALPRFYTLLQISVPDEVEIETLAVPEGSAWKADRELSRQLGDAWLMHAATAIARVPSAILPNTNNYLLNPLHPSAQRIELVTIARSRFDPRLLRNLRG